MALRLLAGMLAVLPLTAALDPRPKVTDYEVNAKAGEHALGAEYLVRSIPASGQTFVTADYLVVEVGFYPAFGSRVAVVATNFSLRLNGKGTPLLPQSADMVAAAMKYEDWERRPTLEVGAGMGDTGILIGRPRQSPRFPGDRRPPETRNPPQPRAPDEPPVVEKEVVRAEDVVAECALPEGETSSAVRGYLYFPWKGKTKSLKSVELLYSGTVVLKLMGTP